MRMWQFGWTALTQSPHPDDLCFQSEKRIHQVLSKEQFDAKMAKLPATDNEEELVRREKKRLRDVEVRAIREAVKQEISESHAMEYVNPATDKPECPLSTLLRDSCEGPDKGSGQLLFPPG